MFIYTLNDIFGVILCIIIIALWAVITIKQKIKQSRCKHPSVTETMKCDAICTQCGKNLGFIKHWRNKP